MKKRIISLLSTLSKSVIIIKIKEIRRKRIRKKMFRKNRMIRHIAKMPMSPASRDFGLSRGKSIARVYIERFLKENRRYIKGDVLEIAENTYTMKYGEDRVVNSYILHVYGWGGG